MPSWPLAIRPLLLYALQSSANLINSGILVTVVVGMYYLVFCCIRQGPVPCLVTLLCKIFLAAPTADPEFLVSDTGQTFL